MYAIIFTPNTIFSFHRLLFQSSPALKNGCNNYIGYNRIFSSFNPHPQNFPNFCKVIYRDKIPIFRTLWIRLVVCKPKCLKMVLLFFRKKANFYIFPLYFYFLWCIFAPFLDFGQTNGIFGFYGFAKQEKIGSFNISFHYGPLSNH